MQSVRIGAVSLAFVAGFALVATGPAHAQQIVQPTPAPDWTFHPLVIRDPRGPSTVTSVDTSKLNPIYSINAVDLIDQYSSHQLQLQTPTGPSLVGAPQPN